MTLYQVLFLLLAVLLLVPLAMEIKTVVERLAVRRRHGPAPATRIVRDRSLPQATRLHVRARNRSLADSR